MSRPLVTHISFNNDDLNKIPQGAKTIREYQDQVNAYLDWLRVDIPAEFRRQLHQRLDVFEDALGIGQRDKEANHFTLTKLCTERKLLSAVRFVIRFAHMLQRTGGFKDEPIERSSQPADIDPEDDFVPLTQPVMPTPPPAPRKRHAEITDDDLWAAAAAAEARLKRVNAMVAKKAPKKAEEVIEIDDE
jgi:hypothetical protein